MKSRSCFIFLLFSIFFQICISALGKDGDFYYAAGQAHEANKEYAKAQLDYSTAARLYAYDNDSLKLIAAKNGWYRMRSIENEFSYSLRQFKVKIKRHYPWATASQVDNWLATKEFLTRTMDGGRTFYYTSELDNLKYRDQSIMDANSEYLGNPMKKFMDFMLNGFVKADYSGYNLPYDRPKDILADLQLSILRAKIPKDGDGVVRIWWPMPIERDCQGSIVDIHIEPAEYLVSRTDPASDMGMAYFEIPISEIKGRLVVRTQIRFKHFQQRFEIDPAAILPYDKGSDLYKKYTTSSLNVSVTPEITARAQQIVGAETNPYLAAKLLNDYITAKVPYSFPEYDTNDSWGVPLSTYVEENQFGDCGYQSAYFAALCRSIGIPARACGGFQYLGNRPDTHFWSEFYLPAPYDAWIPNDVTVAEMNTQALGIPDSDMKAYNDYYFGQQDPFRMVVQNDIDIKLDPEPEDGRYFFKACLQVPLVLFYEAGKAIPMGDVDKHFYRKGTYSFNYDNAISSVPEGEIEVDAADFSLAAFSGGERFLLKDEFLGRKVSFRLAVKEFSAGNTKASLLLPERLSYIAYRLSCLNSSAGQEVFSARWVIIKKP